MQARSVWSLRLAVAALATGLAALALTPRVQGAGDQAGADYVGNNQCKVCHNKPAEGEQWKKWSEMMHARAYKSLASDKAKAVAEKAGVTTPPQESPECLRCHVTAFDATTFQPGTDVAKHLPPKIGIAEGVQCESCHGPASLHVADGKKYKMQGDTSIDMSAHQTRPDARVCAKCHSDQNPTYDPGRYTLEDGTTQDFDFEQAWAKIAHMNPQKQQEKAGK